MFARDIGCGAWYTGRMQNDSQPQDDWQQPNPAVSGAPYESVADGQEPSQVVVDMSVDEAATQTPNEGQSEPIQATQDHAAEADESVVQWQSTEYIQHARTAVWFIVLAVVSLILIAIAVFLMQSISFAILVPVMAAALVIYVKRPPALIDYVVSRKGIHINDRLYSYEDFRSFGILSHDGIHAIIMTPRKRFQLSQTMYFSEEIGESLVDMLAARLPMSEVKQDAIDHFLARLRL